MLVEDLLGACELLEDDRFGLDAVAFLAAAVGQRDGHGRGGPLVRRQDRFEHCRTHGIAAVGDLKRELGGERRHTGRAATLPLGPDEAEMAAVVVRLGAKHW